MEARRLPDKRRLCQRQSAIRWRSPGTRRPGGQAAHRIRAVDRHRRDLHQSPSPSAPARHTATPRLGSTMRAALMSPGSSADDGAARLLARHISRKPARPDPCSCVAEGTRKDRLGYPRILRAGNDVWVVLGIQPSESPDRPPEIRDGGTGFSLWFLWGR